MNDLGELGKLLGRVAGWRCILRCSRAEDRDQSSNLDSIGGRRFCLCRAVYGSSIPVNSIKPRRGAIARKISFAGMKIGGYSSTPLRDDRVTVHAWALMSNHLIIC